MAHWGLIYHLMRRVAYDGIDDLELANTCVIETQWQPDPLIAQSPRHVLSLVPSDACDSELVRQTRAFLSECRSDAVLGLHVPHITPFTLHLGDSFTVDKPLDAFVEHVEQVVALYDERHTPTAAHISLSAQPVVHKALHMTSHSLASMTADIHKARHVPDDQRRA